MPNSESASAKKHRASFFLDPRALLGRPAVYAAFRGIVSTRSGRDTLVRDYIRARPGDRVLDIGCGPGVILQDLPDVDYTGIDLEERYVAEARRRFGGRGRFLHGTASLANLDETGAYDIALAIAVLHHLDDREAKDLLHLAKKALRPGGRLVTLDCCYTANQSRAERLIIGLDRGRFVRRPEEYERLIAQTFPDFSPAVRRDLLRIPYTHFLCVATA